MPGYSVTSGLWLMMTRYSEFDDLRQRLVASFPHARNALPALPPKSVLCMPMIPCLKVLVANIS